MLLLTAASLLIPVAIWIEHSEATVWNERLLWPTFEEEPNRHTPHHALGTFLPPTIAQDVTFSAKENPIILAGTTTIVPGVQVTFEPGVMMVVHEYGQIIVKGMLSLRGSAEQPVRLTSNEAHIDNRVWAGIVIQSGGQATINHAIIRYASPAISCMPQSKATISNARIEFGNLGIYTETSACAVTASIIRSVRDGVVAVGVEPAIQTTNIKARNKEILTY